MSPFLSVPACRRRHLVVKRRERLTARERRDLAQPLRVAPDLGVLRDFVDAMHRLFERGQTEATAWRRHAALLGRAAYAAVPELAKALRMVAAEKFAKVIAFLRSPVGQRVRTNNHVERRNRVLRLCEKSRYKWRTARTKVRFVWLIVERRWGQRVRRWAAGGGVGSGQGVQRVPRTTTEASAGPRTAGERSPRTPPPVGISEQCLFFCVALHLAPRGG